MLSTFTATFRFMWGYWRRHRLVFAGVVGARSASTLLDACGPLASGAFVDAVARSGPEASRPAVAALGLFLGLIAAMHLTRWIHLRLWNWLASAAMRDLAGEAFAKVQLFSADWHANAFAGATVRKITRGMGAADIFGDTLMFGLLPSAVVTLAVTGIFAWRWPWLGAVAFAIIALFAAVSVALTLGWIQPAARRAQESDTLIGATLADAMGANAVVKAFAEEEREAARFTGVAATWRERSLVTWNRAADTGLVQTGILVALQAAVLGSGLWLWSRGAAGPGEIAYLLTTQFVINGYLRDIGQHVRNLQRSVTEMEDVIAFQAETPGIVDRPGAAALAVREGRIALEGVAFRYDGQSSALYEGLDLVIRPGERVGLVGHSGSGKSTFVRLLQRLYEPGSGRILVDGQDIAGVTQASLRRAIGIVPQDPVLFHRSLAENIAYGRPDATAAEIEAAARLAHAHDFIAALPGGYATAVGERGVKLSGGERQRVAIARAILADTPILVLDEATSSLDSRSEALIRDALDRLARGRTTIVVAHRLATVRTLDRILVFDRGRIVEDGTHDELVARPGGHYRALYETQRLGEAIVEAPRQAGAAAGRR